MLSTCRRHAPSVRGWAPAAKKSVSPERVGTSACAITAAARRRRSRRTTASNDMTSSSVQRGHSFTKSSSASDEASRAQACNQLITNAAIGVVDKRQPVSSRQSTPAACKWACMRLVSRRSCATMATGTRPSRKWPSTLVAAISASSWALSAVKMRMGFMGAASAAGPSSSGCAAMCNGGRHVASGQCASSACANGSTPKPGMSTKALVCFCTQGAHKTSLMYWLPPAQLTAKAPNKDSHR